MSTHLDIPDSTALPEGQAFRREPGWRVPLSWQDELVALARCYEELSLQSGLAEKFRLLGFADVIEAIVAGNWEHIAEELACLRAELAQELDGVRIQLCSTEVNCVE